MALPLLVLQVARFLSDADYCLLSTEVNAIISALKVAHRTAGLTDRKSAISTGGVMGVVRMTTGFL